MKETSEQHQHRVYKEAVARNSLGSKLHRGFVEPSFSPAGFDRMCEAIAEQRDKALEMQRLTQNIDRMKRSRLRSMYPTRSLRA